jgi:TetR/AcrR family transcriptional regulator, regulator of cefoperazone and chloramphenicol sensitivity
MNTLSTDRATHAAGQTHDRHLDRGVLAREQLISNATRIFAAKGYAAATTREICDAAGANIAAIHYYFGDKEGLYRAALLQPIKEMTAAFGRFDDPSLSFDQAMRMFLGPFIAPSAGDLDRDVMRIHLREMMEPSEVFREITAQTIVPAHKLLAGTIARHCGLAEPDADVHQLAFAMVAMAHDYCMSREFMKMLAPDVLDRPCAMERILDRLVGYSRALLDYEIERRRADAAGERSCR